jgi:hypothetical protein
MTRIGQLPMVDVGPEPLSERPFDRALGDATQEHGSAQLDPLGGFVGGGLSSLHEGILPP